MTWTPCLEDTDQINNSGGQLILLARDEFLKRFPDEAILRSLHDSHGVIGFEGYYKILCAKKYVYGSIVSCHEFLVRRAIEQQKGILMYILKANKFYLFNPSKIMECGIRNTRGHHSMINFEIKRGINAETQQKE